MAPSTSSTAGIIFILPKTTPVYTKDVLPTFSTLIRENLEHSPPSVADTSLQQSPIPATDQPGTTTPTAPEQRSSQSAHELYSASRNQ
ncbi:hypothetical protein PIB30_061324, partial [Stylosanthes scabra]|nr:hypothetical protein [Stylosanthes scabra]